MLVISRRQNEEIVMPELGISIDVHLIAKQRVQLAVKAPKAVRIYRRELVKGTVPNPRELENQLPKSLIELTRRQKGREDQEEVACVLKILRQAKRQLESGNRNEAYRAIDRAVSALEDCDFEGLSSLPHFDFDKPRTDDEQFFKNGASEKKRTGKTRRFNPKAARDNDSYQSPNRRGKSRRKPKRHDGIKPKEVRYSQLQEDFHEEVLDATDNVSESTSGYAISRGQNNAGQDSNPDSQSAEIELSIKSVDAGIELTYHDDHAPQTICLPPLAEIAD